MLGIVIPSNRVESKRKYFAYLCAIILLIDFLYLLCYNKYIYLEFINRVEYKFLQKLPICFIITPHLVDN